MSQANLSTDTTVARAYETHMVPGMFAHWAEFVVGRPSFGCQHHDTAACIGRIRDPAEQLRGLHLL